MKTFRILDSDQSMLFVRGARLKRLIEASYQQLERGTHTMRSDAEERADQGRLINMEIHTFPPNKAIDFRGIIQGKTNKYQSIVFFRNVDYQEEDTPNNLTFKDAKEDVYHIAPINLASSNCQVRCTCPDFRWTFSVQLQSNDSLYGDGPPLYQKKDPDHAPRNPRNIPGVCKHIMAFVDELNAMGVFRAGDISGEVKSPEVQPPENQSLDKQSPDEQDTNDTDQQLDTDSFNNKWSEKPLAI